MNNTGLPSLIELMLNKLNMPESSYKVAMVIISVAVILFVGFLGTRITKKLKLPNVTAYIVVGILLVPIWTIIPGAKNDISGIVPRSVIDGMEFLTEIALAFIAFSASEFFRFKNLKSAGVSVIIITIFEAVGASILVFLVCRFALGIDTAFSLVLAALSSATAPASTIMTIRQTKAKGPYVNTLLQVVALDDVVSLVLYTVAISVCMAMNSGGAGVSFESVGLPILKNLACLAIGFGMGFILKLLISEKRTTDNRLIIVIAVIFLFCGICSLLDQSPLLGCMAMGMVYINLSDDDKLFKQLAYFSPPILLCFFVRSGMNFNLKAFTDLTPIGYVPLFVAAIVYFIVRILGKYGGAYAGCAVTKKDKSIKNYLGLGLIPQAGVAIGLATMGARIFTGQGHADLGNNLITIILASSVLYELVGPGLSKLGLYLSKSYTKDINEVVPAEQIGEVAASLSPVELLTLQINKIREDYQNEVVNPEEEAFNEAIDQYYEGLEEELERRNVGRFINRRR